MQEFLLVLIVVIDAFFVSFSYGSQGIRIPWSSALLISGVSTVFLVLSSLGAAWVGGQLSREVAVWLSFGILFLLGCLELFQNGLKAALRKRTDAVRQLSFRWSGIAFAVTVYLDETKADADCSKNLSPKEALLLGVILSLDALGAGFGCGLSDHDLPLLCGLSLLMHLAVILLGQRFGKKTAGKLPKPLLNLNGVLLILLAFFQLF